MYNGGMELENTAMLDKDARTHKEFTKLVIELDEATTARKHLRIENAALKYQNHVHMEDKARMQEEMKDLYNKIYVLNGGDVHSAPFTERLTVDKS